MPQKDVSKTFEEYKGRLVPFVRKRLYVKDDAEDIVQEIFYQLSRMNYLAKPVEQTVAWLFRVARNMIINWNKKKRDIPFSGLKKIEEENQEDLYNFVDILLSNNLTPEMETLRSIIWENIQSALDELPSNQRDVFIQMEFLGLSVKEISEKTNIPVNTILSRKHYAVKYLRKKLKCLYEELI